MPPDAPKGQNALHFANAVCSDFYTCQEYNSLAHPMLKKWAGPGNNYESCDLEQESTIDYWHPINHQPNWFHAYWFSNNWLLVG